MMGDVLAGRYRVERLLGQGGMGSVYEATHTATGRRVAVKVITAGDIEKGDPRVARFEREARAAGALVSDHIAGVLDAGEDPVTGAPYMVMEYLDGEDLAHLLKRTGPLRPEVALRIVAQACLGLQKAHDAGVIHRDIKPANLFLTRREEGVILVKLLDFGIAKIRLDESVDAQTALTNTGNVLGSPHYLSPEQARASKDVDARADVWSLGVTLYRALTGRTPHEAGDNFINLLMAICLTPAPPVQSLAPWVPAEVAEITHRALEIDRDARFPSAAAMLDALRPLLPDGWALHASMLVPLDDSERAVVAPESRRPSSVTPPPSASSAGTPDPTAVPSSPPPRAPSPAPPRRAWGPALFGVGLAGAALAGVLALTREGAGPRIVAATTTSDGVPPATAVPVVTPSVSPAATAEAARRVELLIRPSDATVEVDGAPASPDGGVLAIEGPLGSIHRVRLRRGRSEVAGEVAVTASGAMPAKMELPAAAPERGPVKETAAPKSTAAPAPAPPATTGKVRTAFE